MNNGMEKTTAPRVSVIMPMYNALPYLGEAIESIMTQTFQDWELLVIDDASTDGSTEVAREYAAKDSRIRLLSNMTGTPGEGPTRNTGIDAAQGEYVAMMDADDISLPTRLAEQVKFMDARPEVVLSGCWVRCFGAQRRLFLSLPNDFLIKALLCFANEPWVV